MLDIGWSELLLVAVVAIIVVGPKDLPKLMRNFGFYAGKIKRAAADFQRQFNDAMVESEADEVRKNIEAIRDSMGEQPMMMPLEHALGEPAIGEQILRDQTVGEPISGEPMAALEAQSHAAALRRGEAGTETRSVKARRTKTPRTKAAQKRKPASRAAKSTSTKPRKATAAAKPRSKTASKTAAKPRTKTARAKVATKPSTKRPAKAPTKARRKS